MEGFLATTMLQVLGYNPHIVRDPNTACAYLVLLGEIQANPKNLTTYLKGLKYWAGDGRNHILLELSRVNVGKSIDNFKNIDTGFAVVLQSTFPRKRYRPGFDVVVPPVLGPPGGDVWQFAAHMLPSRRKYLASFQGEPPFQNADNELVTQINRFQGTTSDLFLFDFDCPLSNRLINQ